MVRWRTRSRKVELHKAAISGKKTCGQSRVREIDTKVIIILIPNISFPLSCWTVIAVPLVR